MPCHRDCLSNSTLPPLISMHTVSSCLNLIFFSNLRFPPVSMGILWTGFYLLHAGFLSFLFLLLWLLSTRWAELFVSQHSPSLSVRFYGDVCALCWPCGSHGQSRERWSAVISPYLSSLQFVLFFLSLSTVTQSCLFQFPMLASFSYGASFHLTAFQRFHRSGPITFDLFFSSETKCRLNVRADVHRLIFFTFVFYFFFLFPSYFEEIVWVREKSAKSRPKNKSRFVF